MRIVEKPAREPALVKELLEVWEKSVKATHAFLSPEGIAEIKAKVPQALREVPLLVAAENERGRLAGFMGIGGERLEILFLLPEHIGTGLGKELLQYGMERCGVRELTVNEENPRARSFYEHMGFHVWKRAETDEQGGPYPLLYMKL